MNLNVASQNVLKIGALLLATTVPLLAEKDDSYQYLALGDSVSFGLNVSRLLQAPPPTPSDFIGYPEIVSALSFRAAQLNASCPGETTASFLKIPGEGDPPDYGCNSPRPSEPPFFTQLQPFKTSIGLHSNYQVSQIEFAVAQLKANKMKLVTLSIGANDVLLLLSKCQGDQTCVAGDIKAVLTRMASNLARILATIQLYYHGPIVITTYAAPTPEFEGLAIPLNATISQVGAAFGARIADGYTAFYEASTAFGHNSCAAGLVFKVNGQCDVHPSLLGQAILAGTVEAAIARQ